MSRTESDDAYEVPTHCKQSVLLFGAYLHGSFGKDSSSSRFRSKIAATGKVISIDNVPELDSTAGPRIFIIGSFLRRILLPKRIFDALLEIFTGFTASFL